MEYKEKRFLAVSQGEAAAAGRWGLPLAHMTYRLGAGPHLFRANAPVPPHGGLMVLDAVGFEGEGEPEPVCGEVLRECALRRFSGVFCRFPLRPSPFLRQLSGRLAQLCREKGLECYTGEGCAGGGGIAVIPTAVSGGTLRARLEEAQKRFGQDRVAVWVNRVAEDFTLPAPTGCGAALTGEELAQRRERVGARSFFSPELCAHYFTYMEGERGHFVLFDDAASLRRKLQLARELGICTAFLPYGELGSALGEMLEK